MKDISIEIVNRNDTHQILLANEKPVLIQERLRRMTESWGNYHTLNTDVLDISRFSGVLLDFYFKIGNIFKNLPKIYSTTTAQK